MTGWAPLVGWLLSTPFLYVGRVAWALLRLQADPDPQNTGRPSQEPPTPSGVSRPTTEASTAAYDAHGHPETAIQDPGPTASGPGNGPESAATATAGPVAWYGHPDPATTATDPHRGGHG